MRLKSLLIFSSIFALSCLSVKSETCSEVVGAEECVDGMTYQACCDSMATDCAYIFSDGTEISYDPADISPGAEEAAEYCLYGE